MAKRARSLYIKSAPAKSGTKHKTRREAERIASEPLQFITYGMVADAVPPEPVVALAPPMPVERKSAAPARKVTPAPDELVRPHPGSRPGGIDINLPTGVRLSVDSYVNEKALARVLRALREAS